MGVKKLKMNKKGLQFKNAFFAMIAISMVIIAVGQIMGSWNTAYGSGITYDLEEYDDLREYSLEANSTKGDLSPQNLGGGDEGAEGRLFTAAYGILGDIFRPFVLTFNMIENIERRLGLPSYIAEGMTAFIVFAFVFLLVAIIFRRNTA